MPATDIHKDSFAVTVTSDLVEASSHDVSSHALSSQQEKRFVQKLDIFILTYCCMSFFFNYLDRAAFANAYVAGLKEALDLSGTNFNVLLSMTTTGYVVGQIPHGIIVQRIPPHVWFPSMTVLWAGLTMCSAACKNFSQLCAVRFFQGLVEAGTYSGNLYIIGSWYKPQEIAKRTAIFTASGQAGQMFAGVMMTAIHQGMNGYAGLPGWKWVFIVDGIITLPLAVVGFLYFPNTPDLTKVPWLKKYEIDFAISRLPPKKPDTHNISPRSLSKRVFFSPSFWILCTFSAISGALEAYVVQGCMLLWMKAKNFPTWKNTTYPLGVSAVGIVSNISAAIYIDATGRRVPMGVLASALQLIATILLLIPNLPVGPTFFAFYLSGASYIVNPVVFGWANIICQREGDDALRSVILYAMNTTSSGLYIFWGIALYPASDAPYWRKGGIAMILMIVAFLSLLWAVTWLDKYTLKNYATLTSTSSSLESGVPSNQSNSSGEGAGTTVENGILVLAK